MMTELVELVESAIASPHQTAFSDLLMREDVRQMEVTNTRLWQLLNMFAYGNYADLDPAWDVHADVVNKLKQLTLVSLATKNRQLSYSSLLSTLSLPSVRALEDLVIDAVYKGIITAKLNNKEQMVEVVDWQARDVHVKDLEEVKKMISACLENIEHVSEAVQKKAQVEENKIFVEAENTKKRSEALSTARKEMEDELRHFFGGPSGTGSSTRVTSYGTPGKEKRKMNRKMPVGGK